MTGVKIKSKTCSCGEKHTETNGPINLVNRRDEPVIYGIYFNCGCGSTLYLKDIRLTSILSHSQLRMNDTYPIKE